MRAESEAHGPTSSRPLPAAPSRYDLTRIGWTFRSCTHRSGPLVAEAASRADDSPAGWLPATVPGLVTQDLLAAGRILDPYYADQAGSARFIEERDFVYQRRFILRPEDLEDCPRARLVFDSLDTFATVYVNGHRVAHHENQFRRLYVDVTEVLEPGINRIAIAFEASWPATVRRAGAPLPFWNEPWERLYVRKSPMSFGWDWAPRIPTVGIPGAVWLELSRGVFADDLWLQGSPVGRSGGSITAQADYTPHETFEGELTLLIDGEERLRDYVSFNAGHTQGLALSDTLPAARRWYPRERGSPHLYDVELRLSRDGEIIHSHRGRVGIRDVELDLGTEEERRFRLLVNGEPLFIKGENWIPMDFLHTRTSDAEMRAYLELLVHGGINLVRVWGGGIIERPAFYEACDELGLLVWQDFPYACGIYPDDEAFLAEAREEAQDLVQRLRSHTCIALWCGNNENEVLAEREAPDRRHHPLYYDVLREVTTRLDPDRPYWPGSPSTVSPEEPADSPRDGDRHDWDVWFGWRSNEFFADEALFCSEFGAQALPQRETLEAIFPREDLWSPGAVSRKHGPSPGLLLARHGAQLDKLLSRSSEYAYPRDLETFIAASQAFQADTVGRMILHAKRVGSGGTIVWNYTSTWPSVCWSLIDWYRRPKQGFYAARRAFEPVALVLEPSDPSLTRWTAHVCLEQATPIEGTFELALCDLGTGELVGREEREVRVQGPTSTQIFNWEASDSCRKDRHALVATFRYRSRGSSDAQESTQLREVRYLSPLRSLRAAIDALDSSTQPTLEVCWRNDSVQLVSKAWHVRVGLESYESPVIWSDNYVDLLPGDERQLELVHGYPEHLWLVVDFHRRVRLQRNQPVTL